MPITIYPEEGNVLNRPPQPSVFDCGNPLTVAEKICNVDKDSVKSVNGIEPDSAGNVNIETGGGGEGTVTSVNHVQPDSSGNVQITAADVGAATTADIPNKLPNPQSLSLMAGTDTVLYDGSVARSMTITPAQIGAATAAQGKKADTSVQSVNGVKPDSSGNVEVSAGEGTVKSVNGVQPDGAGNVEVDAQSIGTTDGSNVQAKINAVELELDGVVKSVNGVGPDESGNVNVGGEATVTVDVGSTITGEPGSEASVTNSGTQQNVVLNFTIPRGATGAQGPKGDNGADGAPGEQGPQGPAGQDGAEGPQGPAGADGAAATIRVGAVTASAPGSSPQVTNVGTENAAVFNFVLPRGEAGPQGEPGPAGADGQDGQQGPQGEPGPAGADGEPGAAATITVGSTTTGAAGTQASVANSGTEYAAVLNFTIPRGEKGPQGPAGPAGEDGAQGPQGPAGEQGPQGPQGPAGESGVTALYELSPDVEVLYNGSWSAAITLSSVLNTGDIVNVRLQREYNTWTDNIFIYANGANGALTCHPNNNQGATIFNGARISGNRIIFTNWYSGYEYTGTLAQNLCTSVNVTRLRFMLNQTDALTSAEGVGF